MHYKSAGTRVDLGLPYRPSLEPLILALAEKGELAFCEFHHEHVMHYARARDFADTLANCGVPLHVHSTSLMFAGQIDEDELKALRDACAGLWIDTFSGHLACGEMHIPLGEVFDRPAYGVARLESIAGTVRKAQKILGAPVAVENVAYYGAPLADEMTEVRFMRRLQQAANCALIFDISNHMTSSGLAYLDDVSVSELRSTHVAYFHVSGGRIVEGRYYDTHADPIPPAHLDALRLLVKGRPTANVLYERDGGFERMLELQRDIANIRSLGDKERRNGGGGRG